MSASPASSGNSWLFSARVDLAAFLGSALVALCLVAVGGQLGWLQADTPEWMWVTAILLIDVAHVYATGFRVYFDRTEFNRRRTLYVLTPLLSFGIGCAVYSESPTLFWRLLAYLAVFHFVRQQYGWVAMYRARAGETQPLDRWVDTLAIYLATVYPLVWWHAHLPREFWWFLPGDFLILPGVVADLLAPIYWGTLGAYAWRAVRRYRSAHGGTPGKDLVVVTTAVCWYTGIVALNSDFAFTVTNVIIHGVPYMVLVYWYRWCRQPASTGTGPASTGNAAVVGHLVRFLGLIWLLAYVEELLWDAGVWHQRAWLFGPGWDVDRWQTVLVPLLAVPQLTHYVLDGFIWRRRSNRVLAGMLGTPPDVCPAAGSTD